MKQIEFTTDEQKFEIVEEQILSGNFIKQYSIINSRKYVDILSREEWLDINVRPERNKLLQETDYLMLADNVEEMTKDEYVELKNYRQALRDLPKNISIRDKVWPVCSEKIKERIKS